MEDEGNTDQNLNPGEERQTEAELNEKTSAGCNRLVTQLGHDWTQFTKQEKRHLRNFIVN